MLRRILILAPLLIMISFLVFSMIQLVPGDPVILMLGEYSVANAESIQALREQLGFDKPFYLQYWNYFTSLVQGDLGMSIRSKKPVLEQIVQRLPSTFELTLAGLGFAVVLGIFLGVVSALYHNRWPDRMAVTIALLGMSIPSFWLGLMLILIFSVYLRWLPVTGTSLKSLVLPALTLGLWAAGPIARFTRSGLLEVMRQDYIRTARSKGLRERTVVWHHMLRNALIPVVTILGIRFGQILAGTIIIEAVFARPGLGLYLLNAIVAKDFPLVQGIILFVAAAYVIVNSLVEVTYAAIDPRIEYG
ncbi:MAG: ABC transporter permease [Truepera sp.]|nr:ABC transporter permease [Truepera sp.]